MNKRRFVFVDESAVNTAMTRRYGRAPRGERAHDAAPRNYGAHTSVIGAMGLRGVVAALTVEGAVAEARGAQVLWLPPYSPDYSPIEQYWSKIKSYLRGAKARSREHLEEALAAALGLVTKADIRGWFKHCGYSLARE